MDLMVKTAMTIKREVDDVRNIQDASVKDKSRGVNLLLVMPQNPGVR